MERTDKIFLFIALFFTLGGGAYFLADGEKSSNNRTAIAVFETISSKVKHKTESSFNWFPSESGDDLYLNDQIITSDSSTANIIFKGSAHKISVGPNTLIKLSAIGDDLNLDIISGSIVLSGSSGSATKNIRINGAELKTGKLSSVRAQKTKGSSLPTFQLLKGKASIKNKPLKAGTVVNSALKKVLPSIRLISPANGSQTEDGTPLQLSWHKTKQHKYNLEIARDRKFSNIITHKKNLKKNSILYTFPSPGTYFWRVKAEKIKTSQVRMLKVKPGEMPLLIAPGKKQVIELQTKNKMIAFTWDKLNKKKYLLELTHLESESKKTFEVFKNQFSHLLHKVGHYSWRVREQKQGTTWSQTRTFSLIISADIFSNLKVTPKMVTTIARKPTLLKALAKYPGPYVSVIAKDKDFTDIHSEKEVSSPKDTFWPKVRGEYFWRLHLAVDKTVRSKVLKFNVFTPIAHKLVRFPGGKHTLMTPKSGTLITWKKLVPGKINLKISKTPDFKKVFTHKNNSSGRANIRLRPGKYFWKLEAASKIDKFFTQVPAQRLTIAMPKPLTTPELPNSTDAEFLNDGSKAERYVFSWNKQKDAKAYLVEMSRGIGKKVIWSKIFTKPRAIWRGRLSGTFVFRIKSIDIWKRKTSFSNYSRLIFPIAPFADL